MITSSHIILYTFQINDMFPIAGQLPTRKYIAVSVCVEGQECYNISMLYGALLGRVLCIREYTNPAFNLHWLLTLTIHIGGLLIGWELFKVR